MVAEYPVLYLKKTSYLVSNEPSTSSKSVKAASFGVPVITEDEFLLKF